MTEREPGDIIEEMERILKGIERENTDEEPGVTAKRHVENIRRQAEGSSN